MISAIIIENEKHSLDSLTDDLKANCPQVKVIASSGKIKEGIELIKGLKPELVFLDIELDDGTGFDLLDKFKGGDKNPFHLIFVTSHNEFALKAFRFSAVDYLLKPVDTDELVEAIKKVEEKITGDKSNNNFSLLLENFKQQGKPQKIALASGDSILIYKTENIVRCESQRNYTMFYFQNEKPLLVSKTMKEYEEILCGQGFERVHNSHIINMAFVKKYVKSDGGYLEMLDGTTVPVAQAKKEHIVKMLTGK